MTGTNPLNLSPNLLLHAHTTHLYSRSSTAAAVRAPAPTTRRSSGAALAPRAAASDAGAGGASGASGGSLGGANPRADQTKELSAAFDFDEPETAREAIDLGLVLCKQDK